MKKKGKSVALLTSHYASWEWLMTFNNQTSFLVLVFIKKLAINILINWYATLDRNLMLNWQKQKQAIPLMRENQKIGKMCMYGLVSDQSFLS